MSKKTYNPTTGKYDDMFNRYSYWEPQNIEAPDNYVELSDSDLELQNDYNNAVNFEKDTANQELIDNAQYGDVLGFLAYNYNHTLESQKNYSDLVNKYGITNIMDRFGLTKTDIKHWNSTVNKPYLLSSFTDEEIKSLGDNYLTNATDYYNNTVKPAQESFIEKQENLLKDNTFANGLLHFSELPEDKQNDLKFKLEQKGIVYDSDEDYNNVFINSTFKKIFGAELYKNTSFEERKKLVKEYSISSLIDNKFKGDPLLYRIQNLDTEDKIKLYNNSLFLKYSDAEKEEKEADEEVFDLATELSQYSSPSMEGAVHGVLLGHKITGTNKKVTEVAKNQKNTAFERREMYLEEYERSSNTKKLEAAQPTIDAIKEQYDRDLKYGNITADDIDKELERRLRKVD